MLIPTSFKVTQMTDFIPNGAVKYSESPLFTEETVPATLLKHHKTQPAVWGKIVVVEGALLYLRDELPAQKVTPEVSATIWPEELHYVVPAEKVKFKIEFYRAQDAEVQ